MHDHDCKHCSSGAGKKVFGAAFAAVLGALAGLLFAPKPGKQLRKDLAKQANSIKKNIQDTSSELQERVHNTFDHMGASLEQHYAELKARVFAMVEQLDSKVKLTQKKYNAIVADVVAAYAEGKEWTEETIESLTTKLKEEWENLRPGK